MYIINTLRSISQFINMVSDLLFYRSVDSDDTKLKKNYKGDIIIIIDGA